MKNLIHYIMCFNSTGYLNGYIKEGKKELREKKEERKNERKLQFIGNILSILTFSNF